MPRGDLEHQLALALGGEWPGAAPHPLAAAVYELVVAAGNAAAVPAADRAAAVERLDAHRSAAERQAALHLRRFRGRR
jgi:hypothetical protein